MDGRPPHVPPGRLTRRGALLAAAAAAGAALVPAPVAATMRAPAPGGLTPARATAYRRLVAALGGGPDPRFARRRATAAAGAFGTWYAEQDPAARAHADAVLDALAAEGGLSYGELRRPAAPERAALAAAAVALAAVACEPPPGADERPVTPELRAPA